MLSVESSLTGVCLLGWTHLLGMMILSLLPLSLDEVLAVLPTAQNLNLAPLGITPKSSRVQNFGYKARKVQLHEETQRAISDTKNTLLQFMSCVFP